MAQQPLSVVIEIITTQLNMKAALFAFSILILAKFSASAAVDLGATASYTPYDRYIRPVTYVLGTLNGTTSSMDKVASLMREGRGFRYSHTEPYVAAMPDVTASRRLGDCKDKALWLCDQLGDREVRFVIGTMKRSTRISHAWVMWNDGCDWWVLDCTLNSRPVRADKVANGDYVPLYSWAKDSSYRHGSTRTMTAAVASKKRAPVASR